MAHSKDQSVDLVEIAKTHRQTESLNILLQRKQSEQSHQIVKTADLSPLAAKRRGGSGRLFWDGNRKHTHSLAPTLAIWQWDICFLLRVSNRWRATRG